MDIWFRLSTIKRNGRSVEHLIENTHFIKIATLNGTESIPKAPHARAHYKWVWNEIRVSPKVTLWLSMKSIQIFHLSPWNTCHKWKETPIIWRKNYNRCVVLWFLPSFFFQYSKIEDFSQSFGSSIFSDRYTIFTITYERVTSFNLE